MDRDRIIEAYIQRMLAWEKPLNQDALVAISKEVGITPAEMHAIKRQAKTHFIRGNSYVKADYIDKAIDELVQAISFDPLNLDILHALANAYNQRYNRAEDPADKQQALVVAQRCLTLKPSDKEAQVLISFLEHTTENTQEKLSQWTRQKLTVLAGGLATVGLGIVVVSRLPVFSASPALLGPAPGTIVPGSAIYDTDDANGTDEADQGPSAAAARAAAIDLVSDVDVPVIFDHPGLVLEARLSELGDYEDEVYYQLQGVFINASDQEFRKLMLNVEFLDRSDVAIATKGNQAIGPKDASLRPGDTHAFSLIQKISSDLVTVRLSVTDTEQAIARNTYVPPTPINYSWDALESETISFELASRSETFGAAGTAAPAAPPETGPNGKKPGEPDAADKEPSQSGPANFNAEWVIINTSDYPIQELTLKADFYDANSQQLQSEEVIVIDNNDAPLLPGETRPFRVIKAVASGYQRYKVSVLDAE
ncbi:MAG: FxLYD domain-containing protein [Cyanobacteria bacterium P01_A01_bin.137]